MEKKKKRKKKIRRTIVTTEVVVLGVNLETETLERVRVTIPGRVKSTHDIVKAVSSPKFRCVQVESTPEEVTVKYEMDEEFFIANATKI